MTANHIRTGPLYLFVLICAAIFTPTASATSSGMYLGASIGNAEIKEPGELETLCATAGVVCADSGDDTSLSLFLGYQFNNYFAMELGYTTTGKLTIGTEAPVAAEAFVDVKGAKLAILPQIPVGEVGAVFGKLGIYAGDTEIGADAPALGFSERDSGTTGALVFGVGGAINLGRQVTLRVEWERLSFNKAFDLAGVEIEAPDVDVISGAVVVRFSASPR